MAHSTGEIALLRAVLRTACPDEGAARLHLAAAAKTGIDPLDYCAHQFGLGNAEVWRRAAQWAGFPFADALPAHPALPMREIDQLDRLGEIRSLRLDVLGQHLRFVAPHFTQVVALAETRSDELARSTRFAPPEAIETGAVRMAGEALLAYAQGETARIWPGAAARDSLPPPARLIFAGLLVGAIVLVMTAGIIWRPVLVPITALILMVPGLMRLLAALPQRHRDMPPLLGDDELPVYSVLIPLRDEAQMVPMLAQAMRALDYPPHKLDVKFVVEAKSPETVAAVQAVLGDPRFRMVVVPEAKPATKPKAIDFALPLVRGDYVVVYDAEDAPEPDQLRKAATLFDAQPQIACLQAELVPENGHENALTALFAGEYAGLFGRFLPALARWGFPVPLGGTSNHFRTPVVRELGGWDAYNVTEDADLGVRLARRGLRADTFDSRTYEEAPLHMSAWMAQRTRWMKGWMQTFIVHNREPRRFLRDIGWRGFAGFQVLVGGMILSSLLHTVFAVSITVRLAMEGVGGLVPRDIWDWFAFGILAAGYGGAFAVVISGLAHRRAWHLMPVQIILPFYWSLHSLAACFAAVGLIRDPAHWAKTTHGLTRLRRTVSPGTDKEAAVPPPPARATSPLPAGQRD